MTRLFMRMALIAVFSVLGIAGAVLPILPGWLFFGVALALLFPNARLTKSGLSYLRRHLPWLHRGITSVTAERRDERTARVHSVRPNDFI